MEDRLEEIKRLFCENQRLAHDVEVWKRRAENMLKELNEDVPVEFGEHYYKMEFFDE